MYSRFSAKTKMFASVTACARGVAAVELDGKTSGSHLSLQSAVAIRNDRIMKCTRHHCWCRMYRSTTLRWGTNACQPEASAGMLERSHTAGITAPITAPNMLHMLPDIPLPCNLLSNRGPSAHLYGRQTGKRLRTAGKHLCSGGSAR